MDFKGYLILTFFIGMFIYGSIFFYIIKVKKIYIRQFEDGSWFKVNKEKREITVLQYLDKKKTIIKRLDYPLKNILIEERKEENSPYIIKRNSNPDIILAIPNVKEAKKEIFQDDL